MFCNAASQANVKTEIRVVGLRSAGKNRQDVQHMPHIRSLVVPALLITMHVWHHTTKGQFSRHSDIKRCQDVSYRAPNLASMDQTETRMNLVELQKLKSAASYSAAVWRVLANL